MNASAGVQLLARAQADGWWDIPSLRVAEAGGTAGPDSGRFQFGHGVKPADRQPQPARMVGVAGESL